MTSREPYRVGLIGMPDTESRDGMTGIYWYAKELGSALRNYVDVQGVTFRKVEKTFLGRRWFGTLSHYVSKWVGRVPDTEVLHSPHLTHLHRKANVLTIHDVAFIHFPKEYGLSHRMWRHLKRRIRRMEILTDSQSVKDEIVEHLGVPSHRIHVAHLAVNTEAFRPVPGTIGSYVVMVGEMRPRKRTLEALEAVREVPGLRVVRVGPPMIGSQYAEQCRKAAIALGERFEDRGYVGLDELRHLYSGAQALLYPSIYEGFGLPPLEAAACGTPSIVGPAPVFHETLGDLAIYTDGSRQGIMEALLSLDNATWGAPLVELASRFSWDQTARSHLVAYRAAAGVE